MDADADRLARRIVRERVVLLSHLPELDPLRLLDPDDEDVEMAVAVDVDIGVFEATNGSRRMLAVEGVRETADFLLAVPGLRRLYCLTNDGEMVAVADGDPDGEMAWAAVYRRGELVAAYTEPADDGLL